jgi:ABC-type glutathione transport system ATPase component
VRAVAGERGGRGAHECEPWLTAQQGFEVLVVCAWLLVEAAGMCVVAAYTDAVAKRRFGVAKPLLFPITAVWRALARWRHVEVVNRGDAAAAAGDIEMSLMTAATAVEEEEAVNEEQLASATDATSPLAPLLSLSAVNKTYDGALEPSLCDISLTVASGECVVLLGANGAGKSTLIQVLTGMIGATSGSVELATSVGYVPQFDLLWDELSVRQHLIFYARLAGIDSTNEAHYVDDVMERVGLRYAADRLACKLSGGMRRRLSIAIALVGDPSIVRGAVPERSQLRRAHPSTTLDSLRRAVNRTRSGGAARVVACARGGKGRARNVAEYALDGGGRGARR